MQPALIVVIAALALLCLLVAAGLFAMRPSHRPSTRLGAGVREAGERTADRAAEFWDWLRLGR